MYKIIKKCPFCGGEAEFVTDEYTEDRGMLTIRFHIECAKCQIKSPTRGKIEIHLGKHGEIITDIDERNTALEAWNRRICRCEKQEK